MGFSSSNQPFLNIWPSNLIHTDVFGYSRNKWEILEMFVWLCDYDVICCFWIGCLSVCLHFQTFSNLSTYQVNGSKPGSLPELHPGRRWVAPQQVRKLAFFPPLSKNQNCIWLVNLFTWLHSRSPRIALRLVCRLTIVPQLSKCLKFEAVWGVLTDQIIWIWTKRYNKTHACIVVQRMARHNYLIDWYYLL